MLAALELLGERVLSWGPLTPELLPLVLARKCSSVPRAREEMRKEGEREGGREGGRERKGGREGEKGREGGRERKL